MAIWEKIAIGDRSPLTPGLVWLSLVTAAVVASLLSVDAKVWAASSIFGIGTEGGRWRWDLQKIFGGHSGCWSLKMMIKDSDSLVEPVSSSWPALLRVPSLALQPNWLETSS